MTRKIDTVELSVHQLEHALLSLFSFGGMDAVQHLTDLHSRILRDWGKYANAGCIAVETVMSAIEPVVIIRRSTNTDEGVVEMTAGLLATCEQEVTTQGKII